MADTPVPTTTTRRGAGPTTTEAFVADREVFWGSFTRIVLFAVIGLVVLLILMAIFLV